MGIVYILYHIFDGLNNCYPEIIGLDIEKELKKLLFKKVGQLDCIEFENTERLDYINRAINGSSRLIWIGITIVDIIFYYIAYFIFMGWYLFNLKPILAISILIVFVPVVVAQLGRIPMFRKLEEQSSSERRKRDYFKKCLTDKEYFKESRLLGATTFFEEKFICSLKQLNKLHIAIFTRKTLVDIILALITVSGYVAIIFLAFTFVMKQEISIGAFAAIIASIGSLFRFMNKLVGERIGWAVGNVGAVDSFINLVDSEDLHTSNEACHSASDIELRDVSFSYPLSSSEVLNNINLVIRSKERIAIVGENGSGKSTLCKVLMGLYQPSTGTVTYGGVNKKNTNFDGISAVFQKFIRYNMTLRENVSISQLSSPMTTEHLATAIYQSGININEPVLEEGLDTMIGREFGGIELSGGQWQRVAIARGLYRSSDLIVLDEPTAAIDPLEEARLYNQFIKLSEGKTSIIVTHRLGAATLADRIVVMRSGEIAQVGCHKELLSHEGEYKRMFEAQSQWYA
jgi:ATP-binding cassette subfamily B protein